MTTEERVEKLEQDTVALGHEIQDKLIGLTDRIKKLEAQVQTLQAAPKPVTEDALKAGMKRHGL